MDESEGIEKGDERVRGIRTSSDHPDPEESFGLEDATQHAARDSRNPMHADAALTIVAAIVRVGNNCILQRARLELAAALGLGREVLPEERVVDVSAAVGLDCGLELDLLLGCGGLGVSSGRGSHAPGGACCVTLP